MRTLLLIPAAAAWGLTVFMIGLHVHFPSEAALAQAKYQVQELSGGDWAIDATEASLWHLSGVSLDDFVLYKVERPRRARRVTRRGSGSDDIENPEEETITQKATPFLQFDRLRARVALLPLIRGDQQVSFDGDLMGGGLTGLVSLGESERQIEIDAEGIDLGLMPIKGEEWEVSTTGKLNLHTDLTLKPEAARESTGEIRLGVDGLAIRSARVMGMDLTPVVFQEAVLDINIANGKAEITKGVFDGDILDATLSGHATVGRTEISRWRLRVQVKLELDESLDQLARFSPDLKDARDDQGTYHLLCTGTLSRPLCNADRSAAGTLPTRGSRPNRRVGLDRGDEDEPTPDGPVVGERKPLDDAAREERRQARLERIRERRERMRAQREKALDEAPPDDELLDIPPEEEFFDEEVGPRRLRGRLPPGLQEPGNFDPELGPPPNMQGPFEEEFPPEPFIEPEMEDIQGYQDQ